ncbi:MAG: ATP-binding protein [Bacteroidales bacterium]|nr:ATP-binding protein [Bacteroidales bacterium]
MGKLLVGRSFEKAQLRKLYNSGKTEFVAIYGRRRVGKTYLVKEFFNNEFDFYFTGIYKGSKTEQLNEFWRQLTEYSNQKLPKFKNWFDALAMLKDYIETLSHKDRILIFLDELPWIDTQKSEFLRAFEYFWNSYASANKKIMMIVCGSATTWMRDKLFGNKGGLYNRMTQTMYLAPFNLAETEEYLKCNGLALNRYQILEAYMILGGIPLYLSMLEKEFSLSQNIDRLFFYDNAKLKTEYNFLFSSLFKESTICKNVIELLAQKAIGMSRLEIKESLKIPDGGKLSYILNDLIDSDFIRSYNSFGKKKREVIYQLSDLFSLYYLRYVKGYSGNDKNHWSNMTDSPSRRAWSGYAFEQVCLHHIWQIKNKLGILGVETNAFAYKNKDFQIDLLIDRRDQVINLCEMKFSQSEYTIDKRYDEHLRERREQFRILSGTKKSLYLTMVTTYGLKRNEYSGNIQNEIVTDDLFVAE